MRAKQFTTEAAIGTNPKRPARAGSRPERGHKEEPRYKKTGVSKDKEDQFHLKLDKLVHGTFGNSPDEVSEGEVVAFPKKHKGDLTDTHECPKCGGDLQGGKYMGHAVKVCMPCKQVYLPPNSGIDKHGNKIDEGKTVKKEPQKPRNFVAKNAINTGAGAHKDKKKAEKQGDVKHKGKMMDLAEMEDILEKASRELCQSSKPDDEMGASNLASCKSQGLRARDGDKSHLIGHRGSKVRIKVGGKKIKGKKYGGPLPDYGTRKGQV